MKGYLKVWIGVFFFETLVFVLFRWLQPECPPCAAGQDCARCYSDVQVLLLVMGGLGLVVFVLWQIIMLAARVPDSPYK